VTSPGGDAWYMVYTGRSNKTSTSFLFNIYIKETNTIKDRVFLPPPEIDSIPSCFIKNFQLNTARTEKNNS